MCVCVCLCVCVCVCMCVCVRVCACISIGCVPPPTGTRFNRLIPDKSCVNGDQVERVIFCSGKVFYELAKERERRELSHKVAIARVEQVGVAIWAGPCDLLTLFRYHHSPTISFTLS